MFEEICICFHGGVWMPIMWWFRSVSGKYVVKWHLRSKKRLFTKLWFINYVEDADMEENLPAPKRCRTHKIWILKTTLESKKEAEAAVKLKKCWSKYYSNESSAGLRVNYRCNAMKFRGKQCAAGLVLVFDSRNTKVHLYRCEKGHMTMNNANKMLWARFQMTLQPKFADCLISIQNRKPSSTYNLVINGFETPTKARLTTSLKLRKEKYGAEKLNYGTLYKWLI